MKRFEDKDRPAPGGTRSGPRARAAQDRKFGEVRSRSRDPSRADPYQRADRPPRPGPARAGLVRPGPARTAPEGERLRAPSPVNVALDPDVARVFRDSEAVNEALRMVIRLARSVGSAPRPAFNRAAPSGPRSGGASAQRPRTGFDRPSRDDRPRERRTAPSAPREPKFEDAE